MTTVLVTATPAETIKQVRDRLRANREHDEDLAGHHRARRRTGSCWTTCR